mmetsp:Transcript_12268/g.18906  ORF Transcript_12268/g.18906 Transcript_12268/m.18906 type:complete len:304 (+) Transcript_12268:181-1092(+)
MDSSTDQSASTGAGANVPVSRWAIVRKIPRSMNGGCLQETQASIDLDRADAQHEAYINALRSVLSTVIVLDADEQYPDCVFVEDPVVVIDGIALINNMGHESRQGEYVRFLPALDSLGVRTVFMPENGEATLDGGDVMQCGEDIFVGISSRTNEAGCQFLQSTFPHKRVHSVPLPSGLHLKSAVSCVTPDYLITSQAPDAQTVASTIAAIHSFKKVIALPESAAANVLYVEGDLNNGGEGGEKTPPGLVLARSDYPASFAMLQRELGDIGAGGTRFQVQGVDMSEDEKADGAITCHSVLWRPF